MTADDREQQVRVTVQASVGDVTYDLGAADLPTIDDPGLVELLRKIADAFEQRQTLRDKESDSDG